MQATFESLRSQFPALERTHNGRPVIYADAPGGTQVPRSVAEAINRYLTTNNANEGGAFVTSVQTDKVIAAARDAAADLLGCDSEEVVFGPNMTSLAFALSRSLERGLGPGDEVVVTRLDHDGNISPWLAAASAAGASVRWVDITKPDCRIDLGSLNAALGPRTRIVAFTLASNAVGTVTPVHEIVQRARHVGALVVADAVHFAPHRLLDVRALDVDVLFCSPYKFFGPHMGLMYARRSHLDSWHPYKVRPSSDESPARWETGTRNHEALAGFHACVDYIASIAGPGADRRASVVSAMEMVRDYEQELSRTFLTAISKLEGVELFGIPTAEADERTPTFALRVGSLHPREVCERLNEHAVFAWDGNYYALEVMEALGLEPDGGAVRIGFCHYHTLEQVEYVAELLSSFV